MSSLHYHTWHHKLSSVYNATLHQCRTNTTHALVTGIAADLLRQIAGDATAVPVVDVRPLSPACMLRYLLHDSSSESCATRWPRLAARVTTEEKLPKLAAERGLYASIGLRFRRWQRTTGHGNVYCLCHYAYLYSYHIHADSSSAWAWGRSKRWRDAPAN